MNIHIYKIILGLILVSSLTRANPVIINPQEIKTIQIQLPSGIVVNAEDSVFCEAGCAEIIPQSNKKKFLLFAAAGLALLYLRKDCCCDTPIITTQPPPLIPPVSAPPKTNEVPEIPTYLMLSAGTILILLLFRRRNEQYR